MKNGDDAPFMSTVKEIEVMKDISHLIKGTSNPRWVRRSLI
jgi:hypothetical protein